MIQSGWLSGNSSSFAIFKDSNPAWTQDRILLETYCSKLEKMLNDRTIQTNTPFEAETKTASFFVKLVLCPALDYAILLKARHAELIHNSINLNNHTLIPWQTVIMRSKLKNERGIFFSPTRI